MNTIPMEPLPKWVVIWGSPVDGIRRMVGPFDDFEEAQEYALTENRYSTAPETGPYWFTKIEEPT